MVGTVVYEGILIEFKECDKKVPEMEDKGQFSPFLLTVDNTMKRYEYNFLLTERNQKVIG